MQKSREVYSLPKGRLARWLTAPGQESPAQIRVALVGTLFGTLPIFFGGVLNTIAVAWVLMQRHPTPAFRIWFFAEVGICLVRLCVLLVARRRAARGQETPTDLFILLAPMWGATVGYGTFVSAISGDWVATTLSFLSAAAMVGGICFRNFAAPRLVMMMIFLSLGPCGLGALLSGEPVFLLILLQLPFYWVAMSIAAQRLNSLLISTMTAERENSYRASHDRLTGLLNREGLFKALEQGVEAGEGKGTALLYIDLDGFKQVNDAFGHETGDLLLKQVAGRLQALAGKQALVARMGGDEFVIIEPLTRLQQQQGMSEAIARSIEQPFDLAQGVVVTVRASIGLSCLEPGPASIDVALRQADTAMYDVKRTRKLAHA